MKCKVVIIPQVPGTGPGYWDWPVPGTSVVGPGGVMVDEVPRTKGRCKAPGVSRVGE
jgi:hypothetical protein